MGKRLRIENLPPDRETALLSAKTGLRREACEIMLAYANLTGKGDEERALTTGLIMRRLISWARAVKVGVPSRNAFILAILTPADPADRGLLKQLEGAHVDHDVIDMLARGEMPNGINTGLED